MWVVFWVSFFAVNVDTFTSVVFATSGRKFFFVVKFLTFWTDMVFVESSALSKSSDVFTGGNTIVVTATWHTSVVVFVPFVSDWVFFVIVGTSIWWWDTFFAWASASSVVFDEFDDTAGHAWWVWNEEWAMIFTFTSVHFAALFFVNVTTFIEFFFRGTNWNWDVFVWEHDGALVWVSFINTSWWINWSALPRDTAISPVINMVVLVRFTSWSGFAPGSLVEANSLFVVVHVNVVSFKSEPSFVKSVITVNNILSVFPLVTVTSFTVIPTVHETVSTREGVSSTVHFNFTNVVFNWVTAAFFWLFTTASVSHVSPSFQTAFVFLFTVNPVVPVVVVVFQTLALHSLVDFKFSVVWAFVADTFVTSATIVQYFFNLLTVSIFTVWIKFTS